MTDDTIPEVEVPEAPPVALLTLPVRNPRPEVDVATVEITDVPPIETSELPEIIPVLETGILGALIREVPLMVTLELPVALEVETTGVSMTDDPLTKILGLPLILELEVLGVGTIEVPLTDTLELPAKVPVMLDVRITDVADTEAPLMETCDYATGVTVEEPETEVGSVDDKTPDVNEVTERLELWVARVLGVEELPVGIELDEESKELDMVDGIIREGLGVVDVDGKKSWMVERDDVI